MLVLFARYVTPLVALAVLVIGLISASYDGTGKDFRYTGFLKESVPTYFLAKTLFCSTALFLLGQLVAEVATLRRGREDRTTSGAADAQR